MKAWRLQRLGGELRFSDVRTPEPRPGSALVRIEASALMSYLKAYVEGGGSLVTASHDPLVIGLCRQIYEISEGKLRLKVAQE